MSMAEFDIHNYDFSREAARIVSASLQSELDQRILDVIPGPTFEWGNLEDIDQIDLLSRARWLLKFAGAPASVRDVVLQQVARAIDAEFVTNDTSPIDDITIPQLLRDIRGDGGIFGVNAYKTYLNVLNYCARSPFPDPTLENRIKSETEEVFGIAIELQEGIYTRVA